MSRSRRYGTRRSGIVPVVSDVELAWWALREPALVGLETFDAVRAELWDPAVPPGRKDGRLAALVRLVPTYGDGPQTRVAAGA